MKINFKILTLIIFLSIILRFYGLGIYPPGPYDDEAAIGYNAFSILMTGKDEYGTFMPTSFRSFDDYKSAFYIYSSIIPIKIFGLNNYSIRFSSAVFGVLTCILLYLSTKIITQKEKIALFSTFFLAISTWHLHFSRAAFEAISLVFLTLAAVYTFMLSEKNTKRKYVYIGLSSVTFAISLYSYQGAKVLIPLVVIFCFFYIKDTINLKKILVLLLPFIIISLPLVLDLKNTTLRGRSVSVINNSKNPINETISGYLQHFSPDYFFIDGDQNGRHNVFGLGQLYVFQFPLLLMGLFWLLKNRTKNNKLILALLFISPIPAAISIPSPHAIRSLFMVIPLSIIISFGLIKFLKFNVILKTILLVLALYNIFTYFHLYYYHYPKLNSTDWQEGYGALFQYIRGVEGQYDKIFITSDHNNPYIFALFFNEYDPKTYQKTNGSKNSFGKYIFNINNIAKRENEKVLLVTGQWESTESVLLKTIYNSNNEIKFKASTSR